MGNRIRHNLDAVAITSLYIHTQTHTHISPVSLELKPHPKGSHSPMSPEVSLFYSPAIHPNN